MAGDEETARARYYRQHVSAQLMLKTMFEITATMADEATAPQQYGSFSICLALSLVSVRP
jgi:hypothetical protein